jgi:hypothetical protein
MRCIRLTDKEVPDVFVDYLIDEPDTFSVDVLQKAAADPAAPFFIESDSIITPLEVIQIKLGRTPAQHELVAELALTIHLSKLLADALGTEPTVVYDPVPTVQ